MSFEKKIWLNVPDENNPPEIPEGQEALARFDADNMNRIEKGIEDSLQKSGGTMEGELILGSEPTSDMSAIPKKYADNNYIRPCDYTNQIHLFVVGTPWIATEDCWVFGRLISVYNESSNLNINGVVVSVANHFGHEIFIFPLGAFFVKKGTRVAVYGHSESVVKAYACIQ